MMKRDADSVFYELTRSICPVCRTVIDGQVLLRDNKVYLRKRCPQHGWFEALVYGDAQLYTQSLRFNKPGTIPLAFSTAVERGCPYDCGLCPEHKQHACLGLIEVNSACNMECPICFADAGPGFSLTLEDVERCLDSFVRTEGEPEVVQFSGGEPSIHPQIIPMLRLAKQKGIRYVMLNTNGRRIARDDRFLEQLAEVQPAVYLQFDGFKQSTQLAIRGEIVLEEKLQALARLADVGLDTVLVAAVERGVNEDEVGAIVQFGLRHPAVRGITFQPVFHAGRYLPHDPLLRMTNPDILKALESQTDGLFRVDDFVPIPCCFPTCNSVTYAFVDDAGVPLPLPRLVNVDDYLDYITNRILPDLLSADVRAALEGLWSASAVPGSAAAAERFSCAACDLRLPGDLSELKKRLFMVLTQDFLDPWTFNQKAVMKCCKEFLLPDGRQIPFCAYNNLGYREQVRADLVARERQRRSAARARAPAQLLDPESTPP